MGTMTATHLQGYHQILHKIWPTCYPPSWTHPLPQAFMGSVMSLITIICSVTYVGGKPPGSLWNSWLATIIVYLVPINLVGHHLGRLVLNVIFPGIIYMSMHVERRNIRFDPHGKLFLQHKV